MRITELLQIDAPPPASPADERPRGGPPKTGKYWVNGPHWVAVEGVAEQMVFRNPERFGMSPEDVIDFVAQYAPKGQTRQEYEHWLGRRSDDPTDNPVHTQEGQMLGEELMFQEGWGLVSITPHRTLEVTARSTRAAKLLDAIKAKPGILQLEAVSVTVVAPLAGPTIQSKTSFGITRQFRAKDYPEFAGAFRAAQDWVESQA